MSRKSSIPFLQNLGAFSFLSRLSQLSRRKFENIEHSHTLTMIFHIRAAPVVAVDSGKPGLEGKSIQEGEAAVGLS
jgi:hypothetical protein